VGVLVLAMSGFAVAGALPGTGSTIHACIQKNSGALRVVGSAKDCKKSERAISFAKEGPRGLAGRTGAQGPAGKDGAPGPQGPQGPQGPAGQDAPKAAPPHQAVIGTATLPVSSGSPIVFDVLGYDIKATGAAPCSGTGTGICTNTGTLGDLELVKRLDANSPVLMQDAVSGHTFPSLTLDLHEAGQGVYRRYTFPAAGIAHVEQSAPDAGGAPVETVSFAVPGVTESIVRDGGPTPSHTEAPVGRLTIGDAGITNAPVYTSDVGVTMSAGGTSGGAGAGKADFSDLTISKGLDAQSAALMTATLGTHPSWASAKLELFAPGTTTVMHTYDLANVTPSSLRDSSTGETGVTPATEDLALSYSSMTQTHGG
jgi:type VI protein secretion system component Hcp